MKPETTPDNLGGFQCPIPIAQYPHVLMAHGGGGKLTQQLIEKIFLPLFHNSHLESRHDGAVLDVGSCRLAFTTDSYVVRPIFFQGGDIGTLAINGTVNDLLMCGARPMYLSAGIILEEGFPMESLWRVARSMQQSAAAAGVSLVTGDTKVVDRGKGDGIYINTAGIGLVTHERPISPQAVRPGDIILISGDIGRHGIAIMAEREGLAFESTLESDCAPLVSLVLPLLDSCVELHCMRDLTRGGLASALVEIAEASGTHISIEERAIPVNETVRGACEILGFDPLYVANEGRFIAIVAAQDADRALSILRNHPQGHHSCRIGGVAEEPPGLVTLKSTIGATRIVDMISGEQLPRIC
jgi:hydrogenase expression/formation protein HypE